MRRLKKERLKTILLLCLIVLCVVQIGIHWNQQAQGWFPFRFIERLFGEGSDNANPDVNALKSHYFIPEAVIVSTGPKNSQWKLKKDNAHFQKIWNDVKNNYIPAIISQKPDKIFPKDYWGTILEERYIRLDFKAELPDKLIFWFADAMPRDFAGFQSVKSIAILPQKDVNETINTIFIYDNNQVYQYSINLNSKDSTFIGKNYYKSLADSLQNEPRLSLLSQAFSTFRSDEETLISLSPRSMDNLSAFRLAIPASLSMSRNNIDQIQESILKNKKDSLMGQFNDKAAEAVFTDMENYYKVLSNGVLEYRYLPSADPKDIGDPEDALSHALGFIELRRSMMGEIGLVLASIKKQDNGYEIHFDYEYQGHTIFFKEKSSPESRFISPLVIKANSSRVLECRWIIRTLEEKTEAQQYSLYFYNLVEKQIPSTYPEILPEGEVHFKQIDTGYVYSLDQQPESIIYPSWVISTDSGDYSIPLLKGGE